MNSNKLKWSLIPLIFVFGALSFYLIGYQPSGGEGVFLRSPNKYVFAGISLLIAGAVFMFVKPKKS